MHPVVSPLPSCTDLPPAPGSHPLRPPLARIRHWRRREGWIRRPLLLPHRSRHLPAPCSRGSAANDDGRGGPSSLSYGDNNDWWTWADPVPGICCGGDSRVAEDDIMCDFLLKLLRAGSMVGTDAALLQELESRAVHTSPSQLSRPGYGRLTSRRSRPRRACQRPMSLTRRRFQPQPPSMEAHQISTWILLGYCAVTQVCQTFMWHQHLSWKLKL
ncbi:unknown protein [Oryza sativa Japonica Group]|uniref:Os01g0933600 protein n=3 Tax=Oryza sativa TaxID=4530 RepID=A0A9K3Y897_ORYSJ|nr:uncharacterized protein LOC9268621 [Oryza sativa Japonica Group]KAF2954168.1 hypothetical protein DAI22_01g460750 [Oryza sativa Japonica Group]BAD87166.1 unknown protein [Oryza sativa Japonica Group]BAG90238.1 unnamed protein product [Oryza sativa Japonica Group]BAH91456.1 Os01g0933600 [Oryza sativa Japonica Group]|eukprot:NP_001172726.1 Os01g0933600 [Oryza sativa Japonica Group]